MVRKDKVEGKLDKVSKDVEKQTIKRKCWGVGK